MENLYTMATAIQFSYENDLDETCTDIELKEVAYQAAQTKFPALDQNSLNKIADIVVTLYECETI